MELRNLKNKIKFSYSNEEEIYKVNNSMKLISDLWEEQRPNNNYSILEDNRFDKNLRLKISSEKVKDNNSTEKIFLNRRSYLLSEFSGDWRYEELSKLITLALGVSGEREINLYNDVSRKVNLRTYPSGGALYTIDIYLYIKNIESIDDGLYITNVNRDELIKVRDKLTLEEIEKVSPITYLKLDKYSNSFKNSNILVFLVGNYQKSFSKYGLLSYRLALLEAGHIAQNLQLISTLLEKKSLPICGYYDDKVEEMLKIDGKNEVCLYLIALG